MYPTDITAQEAAKGYAFAIVTNPKSHYLGALPYIRVVACDFSADMVKVKVQSPAGDLRYSPRRRSDFGPDGELEFAP